MSLKKHKASARKFAAQRGGEPDQCAERPALDRSVLDLIPVATAALVMHADEISLELANDAFRAAGFGDAERQSVLLEAMNGRIRTFMNGPARRHRFEWATPDIVDSRHYIIHLTKGAGWPGLDHCLLTLVDHTAERRIEDNLRREMTTDSLTGLPNRVGFSDLLDAAIEAAGAEHFAVLAINLDRFSRVNACMGGIVGDELLISVARRLKGALRARDWLARTGGDEFAILIRLDQGAADALQVAHRIENALAAPFRLSDFEIRLACSIGIGLGENAGGEGDNMIRQAQFAMKRAKRSGRPEIYATRALDYARAQFSIETELRRAIDQGELELNFQPIADLATGRIVSFESLARWTSKDGVEITPATFIPVAEESGLIVPLGRWAMAEALRTLSCWDKASGGSCGAQIAVNLSAIQLQRDQVAPMVEQMLLTNGLSGNRLTLELTESAIVSDPESAGRVFNALKALGCSVAMDDFGTGFSNLAYLQKLPIDMLKIDRSFVYDMLSDRDKVAIVRAILSLAQALGMETVAEGIESRDLEQTLSALGCSKGQGYLYSRPLSGDEAYAFFMERNQSFTA